MKKYIALSAITVGLLSTCALNADDTVSKMFSEGKVSGQLRVFTVVREVVLDATSNYTRDTNAIGGYLKFQTADYNGLSFGTALYTTNGVLNDNPRDDYKKNDPSMLGKNNESYSLLGEAYLQYKFDKTTFKGGRIKFNSPLIGTDDARMMTNLIEAYVLVNKDIKNTTLTLGHVNKFAQGTFARVYNGGLLPATAGYSAVDTRNQVGKFVNMGSYAFGESTAGVTMASAVYKNGALKAQLWDYYAHDISNTIYGDINYNIHMDGDVKPFVAAQFIKQSDVGDSVIQNGLGGNGDMEGFYAAAKIGAKYKGFTAYVAYSQTTDNDAGDNSYQNAIITTYGGMPAYTQGMVTRHQFLAGTDATKIVGAYSFKKHGVNMSAAAYYTSFDMDANSGYGIARTATEPGFDIQYYPAKIKNLQLRFRGNFPRKFAQSTAATAVGWNEYRFIVNYNF